MTDSHTYRLTQTWTNPFQGFTLAQLKCCMSTDDSLHVPSENHQCDNRAYYPVPKPLGEYLVNARVCKTHLKYLLRHQDAWIRAFQEAGLPKGQNLASLQELYRKQTIMSEIYT